jgi:hypothetical protein
MELPADIVQGLSNVVLRGIEEAEAKLKEKAELEYTPDKLLRQVRSPPARSPPVARLLSRLPYPDPAGRLLAGPRPRCPWCAAC